MPYPKVEDIILLYIADGSNPREILFICNFPGPVEEGMLRTSGRTDRAVQKILFRSPYKKHDRLRVLLNMEPEGARL